MFSELSSTVRLPYHLLRIGHDWHEGSLGKKSIDDTRCAAPMVKHLDKMNKIYANSLAVPGENTTFAQRIG
jgi:hypothetical protein